MADPSGATSAKVDLTSVRRGSLEWTMLVTLYLRAYESRSVDSILGDRAAVEAVDRIEYDFERMRKQVRAASNQYLVALRAHGLDRWATDFLARHADAVVLHLGCGLDSRPFRISVPPTVDWYDLDVPEVIDFRRKLFSDREHYRMIGSSVTETGWLERIPTGRPVLVIAEGLLMFLAEQQVRDLVARLTARFTNGELLFDGLLPWIVRLNPLARWGLADPHTLERWNPRLRLKETSGYVRDLERIPDRRQRRLFRLIGALPGIGTMTRNYRYEILPPTAD